MQNAVDQEEREFPVEGMAVRLGLSGCGLHGDDDVAEQMRLGCGDTPLLRKRKHVRGTIVIQVGPMEPPDGPITDEEDRDLMSRSAQGAQCSLPHPS